MAVKTKVKRVRALLYSSYKGLTTRLFVFCSLACDLHVTQTVDGNKGIHAMVNRNLVS